MIDKLLMENYLLVIKSTIEVYVHGTLESSNENVRGILKTGLDNTLKHQKDIYVEMTNRSWYKINNVDLKIISQTITKIDSN